jgi:hypothetical protein
MHPKEKYTMSTSYASLEPIRMADLFDGHLDTFGVHEHYTKETTPNQRCVTDGRNFLWVNSDEQGLVSCFSRYGGNAPQRILSAVAEEFGVQIVSEHEPEFWGFKTMEEWDAAQAAAAEKHQQEFYDDAVRFATGESHNIRPDTNGMIIAEIAKRLIAESPDLAAKDKRPELIKAVERIYDRDHKVFVKLSDEDLAFATMAVTPEDDLPQA